MIGVVILLAVGGAVALGFGVVKLKDEESIAGFPLGAGIAAIATALAIATSIQLGRPAGVDNLQEQTIYCVAATLDGDKHLVRDVGANKMLFVQGALPSGCFVIQDEKVIPRTPAP